MGGSRHRGERPKTPDLVSSGRRLDHGHSYGLKPVEHLAGVARQRPEHKPVIALGLGLQTLAMELKRASAILLGMLVPPPAPALEAELRSALQLCAQVHAEEIWPAVVQFSVKSGATSGDWAQALQHRSDPNWPWRLQRPGGLPGRAEPRVPADEEVAALQSSRQQALLRALDTSATLGADGVQAIKANLLSHFCACERLRKRTHAQPVETPPWMRSRPASVVARVVEPDDFESDSDNETQRGIGRPRPNTAGASHRRGGSSGRASRPQSSGPASARGGSRHWHLRPPSARGVWKPCLLSNGLPSRVPSCDCHTCSLRVPSISSVYS